LGVSDYFAVIEFDSSANHLGGSAGDSGDTLQRATDENKNSMLARIDSLQADGSKNRVSRGSIHLKPPTWPKALVDAIKQYYF